MADNRAIAVAAGVGVIAVGGAIWWFTRTKEKQGGPSVPGYLAQISAATTLAQLETVRQAFEGDYLAGLMRYSDYLILYDAYVARYYQLAAAPARQSVQRVTTPMASSGAF